MNVTVLEESRIAKIIINEILLNNLSTSTSKLFTLIFKFINDRPKLSSHIKNSYMLIIYYASM